MQITPIINIRTKRNSNKNIDFAAKKVVINPEKFPSALNKSVDSCLSAIEGFHLNSRKPLVTAEGLIKANETNEEVARKRYEQKYKTHIAKFKWDR